MSDNLKHWNTFADIDPQFTKAITGKPYKGTSPSPQYVIKCLTEMFGPMGEGFGAHVVAEGFQPLGEEVLHWCRIEFWHTDRSNVFETYGQTKALMKTRNGMMSDEDAPKKSFTDALVKAASYMGVAANIFLGRWDDQKYVEQVNAEYRKAEQDSKPEKSPEEIFDWFKQVVESKTDVARLEEFWNRADVKEYVSNLPEELRTKLNSIHSQRMQQLSEPTGDELLRAG